MSECRHRGWLATIAALVSQGCAGSAPHRGNTWIEEDLGSRHQTASSEDRSLAPRWQEDASPAAGPDTQQKGSREIDDALAALAGAFSDAEVRAATARIDRALAAHGWAALSGGANSLDELERRVAGRLDRSGGARLAWYVARLWAHGRSHDRATMWLRRGNAAFAAAASGAISVASTGSNRASIDARDKALARDLAELTAQLDAVVISPQRVAVLLPLSGRFAAIGRELRRTVELVPALGVQWQFLDTGGDPHQASAAVDQADRSGAVAILGPVGDRESLAAARRAAQRGVPIALLAPGDGADASLGVFRLSWSAQDEARAVAQWAAVNDFSSVAVLAPRDDVGNLAASAFIAAARTLGLTVTAQGQYDAVGGAIEPDLKQFLNLVPARNPRLAAHLRRGGKRAWQTFVPEVGFSLLYLPDRADRAALVAAFLPYFGVELRSEEIMDPVRLQRKYRGVIPQVVQLIGGAGWNVASLPPRAGSAVQGAMIVDVCSAQRDDVAAEVMARLETELGHPASSAAAQTYDAAAWLVAAMLTAGSVVSAGSTGIAPPRQRLRDAMQRTRLEEGACGSLSLGSDGEVVRDPTWLQVDGEELVPAP
jgi:branched-chain amino acid transport system substrate-binding protein